MNQGGAVGQPRGALARWARFVDRRAKALLVVSALAVVGMGVYGAGAFEDLALPKFEDADSESVRTANRLARAAGYDVEAGLVVLVRRDGPVTDAVDQREIARLAGELRKEPGIARVQTPAQNRALLAPDGRAAVIQANFRSTSEDGQP